LAKRIMASTLTNLTIVGSERFGPHQSTLDTLEKGAPDYFHFSTHRSQFLFFRFFFSLLFFARRLLSITELTINNYIIKVPNETDRLVSRTREASQRKPSITLQGSTTKSHQIK